MRREGTVTVGGRTVGYVDFGPAHGDPVLWCHGGPGSRLEPMQAVAAAEELGLRLIGIDRPGYGLSTPQPGRTIGGWTEDAVAVLDALQLEAVGAIGVSTGGAYALALAALCPERVDAVVACCALTDMSWPQARDDMPTLGTVTVWDAPDRSAALAAAAELWGEDGSNVPTPERPLPPADMALFSDPQFLQAALASGPARWTFGVQGYTDDRLADGKGWHDFDVADIDCPVLVIHGALDVMVPVAHARHTASVVPDAELRVYDDDGHLSVIRHAVPSIEELV